MKLNKQQSRLKLVLEHMIDHIMCDEKTAELIAEELEIMLNKIRDDDGFGTEAQDDPRGDGRNGDWSIDFVEGIDS
jgi:hypothetical protein